MLLGVEGICLSGFDVSTLCIGGMDIRMLPMFNLGLLVDRFGNHIALTNQEASHESTVPAQVIPGEMSKDSISWDRVMQIVNSMQ